MIANRKNELEIRMYLDETGIFEINLDGSYGQSVPSFIEKFCDQLVEKHLSDFYITNENGRIDLECEINLLDKIVSLTASEYVIGEDYSESDGDFEKESGNYETMLNYFTGTSTTELASDYDGGGDSGDLGSWQINQGYISSHEIPNDVEDIFWRLLEYHYGGWEINEGSSGSISINLYRDEISYTISHVWNTEEYVECSPGTITIKFEDLD